MINLLLANKLIAADVDPETVWTMAAIELLIESVVVSLLVAFVVW